MPMWRCPHCGTPQAETARCWVCRRSSTACATCRNFRRSVAAQLGYCGLDAQRRPLRGDEIRACWEASAATVEAPAPADAQTARRRALPPLNVVEDRTPVRRLEFVEVPTAASNARRRAAIAAGSRDVDGQTGDRQAPDGHRAGGPADDAPQVGRFAATTRPVVDAEVANAAESPVARNPAEPSWSLWGDADL